VPSASDGLVASSHPDLQGAGERYQNCTSISRGPFSAIASSSAFTKSSAVVTVIDVNEMAQAEAIAQSQGKFLHAQIYEFRRDADREGFLHETYVGYWYFFHALTFTAG